MSKIVLVKPPLDLKKLYGKLESGGNEMPPLGICYLASFLRKEGFEVSIIDASPLKLDFNQTVDEILRQKPGYVGITAVTISIKEAARLAEMIKQRDKNIIVIIGGPHVTAVPHKTFEKFTQFDIGVIGEGEITITELLRVLDKGGSFENLDGIIYRKNGNICMTKRREFIRDLDALPFPAWDLLPDIRRYYHPAADSICRLPSTSLVTSRGCSGRCVFCDNSVFGNACRAHSAEYTLGMVRQLYHNYGIRDIHFYEDNFTLFRSRLIKICETIIQEKMDLTLFCMARVDTVNPEILKLMRKAGFWQIAYGIESGSQKILDNIGKKTTVEQNRKVLAETKKAGIKTQGYLMIGSFGETKETIRQTFDFLRKAAIDDFHITYFTPFPGSPAFQNADEFGRFNTDWEEVDQFTPNFIPSGLTEEELIKYHKLAYRLFYLRPRIMIYYIFKMIKQPKTILKLANSFIGFMYFIILGNKKGKEEQ